MPMTRTEVGQLVAVDVAFTRRTIGRADIEAWHAALEDLDFEPAREAIIAFYKRAGAHTQTFVRPGDIRAHIDAGVARLEVENRVAAQIATREQREQRQLVAADARPDPRAVAELQAEAYGAPCRYCHAGPGEPCRNPRAEPARDGLQPPVRVPHASRINDRRRAIEQDLR